MKKYLIILIVFLSIGTLSFGQLPQVTTTQPEPFDSIQTDSIQQAKDSERLRVETLKQAIYNANVAATVQKLMLAYGTVECSKDTLQTMISRDQQGNYYLHVSAFTFPIQEGRIMLSIPEKNREALRAIDNSSGIIEINKYALEKETRIDGKPMPNYKITLP